MSVGGAVPEPRGMEQSRSALVIGATGDIGQAVATVLTNCGFTLILTHSSSNPPEELGRTEGQRRQWQRLDVRDSVAVRRLIEDAEQELGPPFALVYCAGIVRDMPLMLMSDDAWASVLDVNLTGAFYCVRAVSRAMMVAGCGRIVLVGSIAARRGNPGQANYSSSKGGLEALSRVVAVELGRYGVTCNVVAPGPIESRIVRDVNERIVERTIRATPLRRLGEPSDVAGAVRYLLSDAGGYVTGQTLVVDGGISAV